MSSRRCKSMPICIVPENSILHRRQSRAQWPAQVVEMVAAAQVVAAAAAQMVAPSASDEGHRSHSRCRGRTTTETSLVRHRRKGRNKTELCMCFRIGSTCPLRPQATPHSENHSRCSRCRCCSRNTPIRVRHRRIRRQKKSCMNSSIGPQCPQGPVKAWMTMVEDCTRSLALAMAMVAALRWCR